MISPSSWAVMVPISRCHQKYVRGQVLSSFIDEWKIGTSTSRGGRDEIHESLREAEAEAGLTT